jgi:hypothetical protein
MTIFESTDRGATKVFDAKGLILTFERQNLNLIKDASGNLVRTNKSDSWICVINDETEVGKDLIERAKKLPGFIKDATDNNFYTSNGFRIIDKIPTSATISIIKTFVKEDTTELKTKAKRLGFLESELLKKDGSYTASATPELISEYESLKQLLE